MVMQIELSCDALFGVMLCTAMVLFTPATLLLAKVAVGVAVNENAVAPVAALVVVPEAVSATLGVPLAGHTAAEAGEMVALTPITFTATGGAVTAQPAGAPAWFTTTL